LAQIKSMSDTATLILDHAQIVQKLKRIAYQIYETNADASEVVIVAVERKGRKLAERIVPLLKESAHFNIVQLNLTIDKRKPLQPAQLDADGALLSGKSVVLIDDVLNSGRTLMYAACHLLQWPVARLHTVVLVDRRHRKFPIKADFVGLTLSTTLHDHINVVFKEGEDAVYLEA
jgi:pyrimidine operon attenuation protein / uracil phosphoribosyltransferase